MFIIMVYDVEAKRVNRVLKTGRKYLTWVQNSVLEGELTPALFARLKQDLKKIIKADYDSIIFYTWRVEHYASREIMGQEKGKTGTFI